MASTQDNQLPEMSEDILSIFIDEWENVPCLWNPLHRDYKNKCEKTKALLNIAQNLGLEWTSEMIARKIDSLKASFRKERSRQQGSTGASGGKRKKLWPLYDRINGFYGTVLYSPKTVVGSDCPTVLNEGIEDIDDTNPRGDIDQLINNIQPRSSNESITSSASTSITCDELPNFSPPSRPETLFSVRKVLGKRPAPETPTSNIVHDRLAKKVEFEMAATQFLSKISQKPTENPEMNFAVSLADDLMQIKSVKTRTIVKHQIRNLVYEALMKEMPDDI